MSNQYLDKFIKQLEREATLESAAFYKSTEFGSVNEVKDGVVAAVGLENVANGELVLFENKSYGMVLDLNADLVSIAVLGTSEGIVSGGKVTPVGKTASIPVTDKLLGRVVDSLGTPIDGGGDIQSDKFYPVEKIAPGVVARKSVSVPLQTGIKAIDGLIPVGRGQRELIIGDRGTGKTTITTDTIINQKGQNVICIYCAIGQKSSKIASTYELLKSHGAMDYTIIVAATASDPAAMQFIAPYGATAIAEYFMDQGRDVLVVYDDLTKHAYAYRELSLILRRPAGREAYPGDVFYLHSRLLERSCRLNDENGGGSITSLPIIETLDNDVSAYIPTNVISITDGQIFLETDLFNSGIRPAINVGVSVSRVGGSAQTKAIKQVAGKLKLDLAQYRELAAFSQFESDLDPETKKFLNRGAKATQILKQNKNMPMSLGHQVAVMWALSNGYVDTIDTAAVSAWEENFLKIVSTQAKPQIDEINTKKLLTPEIEEVFKNIASQVV